MPTVAAAEIRAIVAEVLAELASSRAASSASAAPSSPGSPLPAAPPPAGSPPATTAPAPPKAMPTAAAGAAGSQPSGPTPSIEVADPTVPAARHRIGVSDPVNASGLENLVASTTARIGVGRAGSRPPTATTLLFGSDHAVTQDAIFGTVPDALLEQFGLFSVQTRVSTRDEYLLRPDLGRLLSDDGRALVAQRCAKNPDVQIVVGDGLSAAAITNNLDKIYPVLERGFTSAGVSLGTPFFVRFCRVGVINDINDVIGAGVVVLLIGERPGLGVADAMSVYSGWRPTAGKTDAHRDVVCMITENGGTNPMEAGAFVVEHVRTVLKAQGSGVDLRLQQSASR